MFNKNKFALILKDIYSTFDNQREFADALHVNRAYLSQYMNMKLENPPTPKILSRIAKNAKGITNYKELMQICGYTDYITDDFFDDNISNTDNKIPILMRADYDNKTNSFVTDPTQKYVQSNFKLDEDKEYVAFIARDDSMLPLLGKNDIAIIEKTTEIKNNKTYLLLDDNKNLIIRKIIVLDNNEYELEALNLRYPKEKSKNIHVIGRVVTVEIKSAFL